MDKKAHNKNNECKEGKRKISIMFWNVTGLSRKDRDFWDYVKKFDIVNLTETWIEEKGWKKIKHQDRANGL
ncbi:Uncharacterized protein DBV15_11693 [Temnothorax longispinosus]|uniref:Endonuclease/exonuclease/phosphatase domain-containing protein n=1 Tax=Temnothorax longispinosus TaxID=300112 RepID=A0A4S2KAZ1_9HYME|nr:Uncharacterized protein DBV15_11693 [Temnothorax longispinosus]